MRVIALLFLPKTRISTHQYTKILVWSGRWFCSNFAPIIATYPMPTHQDKIARIWLIISILAIAIAVLGIVFL
jgi:hypothetical protein